MKNAAEDVTSAARMIGTQHPGQRSVQITLETVEEILAILLR
jgi:hypothetical protein